MLIFWKERLVFLSTPKTGSTSIETALEAMAHVAIQRPPELKHMSAMRYTKFFAPLLEKASGHKFTTVALMRDPVDWLGSWYRYRQRTDIADRDRSTKGISFEQAAERYLSGRPGDTMNVGSQARFLGWNDGGVAVDKVFRYETIDQFVHFLEDRLDCEIILPRLNVSPKGSLALMETTTARLHEKFTPDYLIYNALDA